MPTEQNKELVTRMIEEIFNRGNVDKADEFLASDFVEREELPPGLPPGREGVKQLAIMMRSAFPDLKGTIEDAVAEGDKVVVRWTCAGTHSGGEFMGVPPTGKKVSVGGDRHHPHCRRQVRRALGPDGQHGVDAATRRDPNARSRLKSRPSGDRSDEAAPRFSSREDANDSRAAGRAGRRGRSPS